jgi:hypothetical protein
MKRDIYVLQGGKAWPWFGSSIPRVNDFISMPHPEGGEDLTGRVVFVAHHIGKEKEEVYIHLSHQ